MARVKTKTLTCGCDCGCKRQFTRELRVIEKDGADCWWCAHNIHLRAPKKKGNKV